MENQKAPEGLHLSNGERVHHVVEWVPVILTIRVDVQISQKPFESEITLQQVGISSL